MIAVPKKNVLGRGLGNLIPINESKEEIPRETNSNLFDIKISEIVPNPNQPRRNFDDASLAELAETIKLHGVIQPITVVRRGTRYEIVSGERRFRACKLAGYSKIPAIVRNLSEIDSLEQAIIENIQREDLNPIDEAMSYSKLGNVLQLKTTELATRIGKNRSTVANLLRLLQLPSSVQEFVKQGKLTEGQVRPLLSLESTKKMEEVAQKVFKESWSARQVEDYVGTLQTSKTHKAKSSSKKDPTILKLETKLRNKIQSRVDISHNEKSGKGKISFQYSSLPEMEKILSKLGV